MTNDDDLFNIDDTEVDEAEEPAQEPTEDAEETDSAEDDEELNFDENGDVIIPSDDKGKTDTDPKETKETAPSESELAKQLAALQKEHNELLSQTRDTLKKLGVKEEDARRGLAKLAADEDGISIEEYLQKRAADYETEEAVRIVKQQKFQQKAAQDLAEIKAAFAGLDDVQTILDLPNFQRFAQLRDMGLSPKEAYIAANPEGVRSQVADATRKKTLEDSKAHLKSSVPKGSRDSGVRMTRSELQTWREMFPGKSDKEIVKLYRETL